MPCRSYKSVTPNSFVKHILATVVNTTPLKGFWLHVYAWYSTLSSPVKYHIYRKQGSCTILPSKGCWGLIQSISLAVQNSYQLYLDVLRPEFNFILCNICASPMVNLKLLHKGDEPKRRYLSSCWKRHLPVNRKWREIWKSPHYMRKAESILSSYEAVVAADVDFPPSRY